MGNPTKLGKILTGMSRALGEVPMTVKMVRLILRFCATVSLLTNR